MKKILYIISILIIVLSPGMVFAQDLTGISNLTSDTSGSNSSCPSGSSFNVTTDSCTTSSEFGPSSPGPSYVLLAPLPGVGATNATGCPAGTPTINGEITCIGIQGYLLYGFKLFIAIAVFLAVVMTIYGGFMYMTVESVSGKSGARQTIEHAIEGLLLALASYLILYTINPDLVNLTKVTIPKLNVTTTSVNLGTTPANTNTPTDSPTQTTNQNDPLEYGALP